ncbi:MAG: PAS domain S-box protein [Thermodesulfobacteriota bacterium]
MTEKDLPTFDQSDEQDVSPRRMLRDNSGTETIDVHDLFSDDVTVSGSFDFGSIPGSPLGKLLQALPVPACLIDESCRIGFHNQALGRICPEGMVVEGLSFPEIFPDESAADQTRSMIQKVFATRKPAVQDAVLGIGQKRIGARINYRALRLRGDRFLLVLIEDLTAERKQLFFTRKHQEELQAANDRLIEEISQRKIAEEELSHRDRLLRAVATAARFLVGDMDLAVATERTLEVLGSASGVARVYIYQNTAGAANGSPKANLRFEWATEGTSLRLEDSDVQIFSYEQVLSPYFEDLAAGRHVQEVVRNLKPADKSIFEPYGVKSVLIVPILVQGRFWGFIGFDDCTQERLWHAFEVAILKTASDILAGAIRRYHYQTVLQKSHAELEKRVQERTRDLTETNAQLAMEIQTREKAQHSLASQLASEQLFSALSQSFISLPADRLDAALEEGLALIGTFAGVDRSHIFLVSDTAEAMTNTHEWCAEGVEPQIEKLKQLVVEDLPWFAQQMRSLEPVWVPCVADLPEESRAEKEHWQSQGITALAVVPITSGGSLKGFIGFDRTRTEGRPREDLIGILRTAGNVFGNALERKRAEESLRESEARFRSIFENEHVVMFLVDPATGSIVDANPAAAAFYGYAREELRCMKGHEINTLPADQHFQVMQRATSLTQTHFEFRHRLADGRFRDVEVATGPITVGGRDLLYSIVLDITERKRSVNRLERELRINEALARVYEPLVAESSSIEEVTDMIVRTCADLTGSTEGYAARISEQESLSFVSTYLVKGCPADGQEGRFFAPKTPDAQFEALWKCGLFEGEPFFTNDPSHHPAAKGVPGWHVPIKNFLAVPVMAGKEVIGQISLANSDRDYDEKDLEVVSRLARPYAIGLWRMKTEQHRQRLEKAVEQATETIIITDAEGLITYVNPAFEQTTGYSSAEAMGKTPGILKSGKHNDEFYQELWGSITKGHPWTGRFINKKKDGSLFEEEASVSPIRDHSGRIISYVAVKRDVTRESAMERQLRRAQKMESIGTLAGGIAHDFNNILTVIAGFAELALIALPEGSETRSDLEQVVRAAGRATDLVKQILAFSRQGEQARVPMSLMPLIKETTKFLRASLPSTIELQQKIKPVTGRILADPTQIQQVLMNLCTNASHAMREQGGLLCMGLDQTELSHEDPALDPDMGEGPFVRLTVSDTGHGIPEEFRERIFEPYFTTKKPGEGTGLGLAVVHGILKSHGGTIRVQSEEGKGSVFNVYLPVVEEELPDETRIATPLPRGKERILVVDDEEDVALLGQRMLQGLGYQVTATTSSQEALETFRDHPELFDLVLTDMTMPKMTGKVLSVELIAVRPDIPVILCTGFSDQITDDEVRGLGIRSLLMKPISLDKIAHAVRSALDNIPD